MLAARDTNIFQQSSLWIRELCLRENSVFVLVNTVSRGKKRVDFARFFFLLLVQRLIEQSMIEEQSIDKFIAKDYFFSLSRVEQFCIPRFEFDFDITMEH